MKCLKHALAVVILIVSMGSIYTADSQGTAPAVKNAPELSGLHDFDFLVGEWRVHHRIMNTAKK